VTLTARIILAVRRKDPEHRNRHRPYRRQGRAGRCQRHRIPCPDRRHIRCPADPARNPILETPSGSA